MGARLSALRAGRTLPPGFFIFKDSWYSFLLKTKSTPGPVRPEGLGHFKYSGKCLAIFRGNVLRPTSGIKHQVKHNFLVTCFRMFLSG
jgi:hypothetical protein